MLLILPSIYPILVPKLVIFGVASITYFFIASSHSPRLPSVRDLLLANIFFHENIEGGN